MRVEVLGAGVVGLSTALALCQDGHQVTVRAAQVGDATTSSVAAALWYPYLAAPADATRRWGAVTYDVLTRLANADASAGVDVRPGVELTRGTAAPDWADDVAGFAALDATAGFHHSNGTPAEHGWTFRAPVADMARYLPWLVEQVLAAGGRIERCDPLGPADLHRVTPGTQARVLCTGLGSHRLTGDQAVGPVRGQVVLLEQVGLDAWVLDEAGEEQRPTYVVPRRDVVVCGGTALPERWDDAVDDETTLDILRRCRALVPALREAGLRGVRVGLRPVRPTVRLDRDDSLGPDGIATIACYGHGGAGVTLSWGCAREVAAIVGSL
ncbi:MAG: FAD-dependent oxidoreductase [Jiangellales bacterium]